MDKVELNGKKTRVIVMLADMEERKVVGDEGEDEMKATGNAPWREKSPCRRKIKEL